MPFVPRKNSLGYAVGAEAVRMLPGMILPSRNGNYFRLAAAATGAQQSKVNPGPISSDIDFRDDAKKNGSIRWTDYVNRPGALGEPRYELVRMEFRQGAPEADPFDLALAAAIPTTSAFLHSISRNAAGKAELNAQGIPVFSFTHAEPDFMSTPTSEQAAAALFNTKDNPNFTFLNELAEKKIACLQQTSATTASGREKVEREIRSLRNLGTRLHTMYCQQYGLKSKMQADPRQKVQEI